MAKASSGTVAFIALVENDKVARLTSKTCIIFNFIFISSGIIPFSFFIRNGFKVHTKKPFLI